MALYSYQAFTKDGKRVSGNIDAATTQAAKDAIVKMGLLPIKIDAATSGPQQTESSWLKSIFSRRVSIKDKIFFTKQLAILLKSGIPLMQALELMVEQTEGQLKNIVIYLKDNIKEGKSLADGLSKYPKVFDNIYIQLVKAGEASGRLEIILERLTVYLERRQAITKKIRGALQYPLIQLGIVILVVVVLLTAVVPQISEVFASKGAALPLPTRILMAMSGFLINHYIILLIMIISMVSGFLYWKSTDSGKRTIDRIKLKIPGVKYFVKMGAVVQFSRTLGMLIEGGVNLAEALNIVTKIVDNKVLVDALNEAKENIIKQGKISQYLKQTNIFPPVAIYLINTGEQSGHLDTMLITVAEYYEAELSELADSLAGYINPVMLLVMGGVVGFIVMAIALPLQQLTSVVSK